MRIYILILLTTIVQITNAQKFNFGISASGNISTVFMQSDYTVNDENFNEIKYLPLPGFEFGLFTSHKLSDRILLINTIDFAHLAYKQKGGFTSRTATAETAQTSDKLTKCSNYLRFNPSLHYIFFDKLLVGTGIQMNVLMWSRTRFDTDFPVDFEDTFNQYYKTLTFSIPFTIGYRFSSLEISMEAKMGIDNRLKVTDSLIKEREGSITIKFSYFFLTISE